MGAGQGDAKQTKKVNHPMRLNSLETNKFADVASGCLLDEGFNLVWH